MKRCPACRRTFADDTITFCLIDGSILSAPYDPQTTGPDSKSRSAPVTEFLAPEPSSKSKGRFVIGIIFALSFLVMNICLLVPIGNRGMSWQEAGLGLIPSALVALICFVLLVVGVGARGRSRATRWWLAALLWSLLVGGIVTFTTTTSYERDLSYAESERTSSYRKGYSSGLYDAYARYDQIGMMYGWATLGFAGVSLLGLIISLALRKKT